MAKEIALNIDSADFDMCKSIQNCITQLRRKEWLGNAEEFPELQTDLDGMQQAIDKVVMDFSQLQNIISEIADAKGEIADGQIMRRKIIPLIQSISRHYALVTQGMGKISLEVGARYMGQRDKNDDTESYQNESPPTELELHKARAWIREKAEYLDSFLDLTHSGSENDGNEEDRSRYFPQVAKWLDHAFPLNKMNGMLLSDVEGFKRANAESERPLEAKLFSLLFIIINSLEFIEYNSTKYAQMSANMVGRGTEFGPSGNR
jgi:hypothetical protein